MGARLSCSAKYGNAGLHRKLNSRPREPFFRITKWGKQSGYFILNHFRDSPTGGATLGHGKIHRFKNAQTEAFRFRRE